MIDREDSVGVRGSDPTSRIDHERIERVLSKIEQDPDSFDMEFWGRRKPKCGTTLCFAGHVVDDEGLVLEWYDHGSGTEQSYQTKGGEYVADVAAKLLGMNSDQADRIFFAQWIRTPSRLREWVDYVLKTPHLSRDHDMGLVD